MSTQITQHRDEGSIPFTRLPSENGDSVSESVRPHYSFDAENHVHLLDGQPLIGTSSVCKSGSGGLLYWAAEQAAVVCLESGALIPTIRSEYKEVTQLAGYEKKKAMDALQKKYPLFKKARFAHNEAKEAAAAPGTDMHRVLEHYVRECMEENGGEPMLLGKYANSAAETFAIWAVANVKFFLWVERHCYSEQMWTGGICDCGAVLNDDIIAVIDWKSSKEAYLSHHVQCAGYAKQIGENGLFSASGDPVMDATEVGALIVFPFGANCGPRREDNVWEYAEVFAGEVRKHKLQQKYDR